MFKKVKKFELRVRICEIVAIERFERMDILSGQNAESVNSKFLLIQVKVVFLPSKYSIIIT